MPHFSPLKRRVASTTLPEWRRRLQTARSVVVLTGAGISADSGVPTFRGPGGFWRNCRAEDLATAQAFQQDPHLVWEWYNWRREIISRCPPNPAHYTLIQIERRQRAEGNSFCLITQNVDGLHRKAGSENLIELHGNIWKTRCTRCGRVEENDRVPIPFPPFCLCGGLLRPHVVWFGEMIDPEDLIRSYRALEQADLMLVIGTSGVVQPAASFAAYAREHGAYIVEVNVTPSVQGVDEVLDGRAAEILPRLL